MGQNLEKEADLPAGDESPVREGKRKEKKRGSVKRRMQYNSHLLIRT